MAKPPGPRTAGRARWRVQTISAGNFWRKAEFISAAQVQSIRGSPRRAKPCGGVILHSLAPQLRLRKIPDFQRLFIILLNIEVCKLIFWGAVLRTLRVVGALTRPRGAAPRRAPTRRGPPFLPRNGGERGPEGRVSPLWTPCSGFLGPCKGSSLFFCLACGPVSYARNGPPTGWAGWGRWFRRREGAFPRSKPSPWGEGAPVRTLGRMRGRPTPPTGREKNGVRAIV